MKGRKMLVIARKPAEEVEIRPPDGSAPIYVAIVQVKGQKVKLGFRAPKKTHILRTELTVKEAPK